MYAYDCPQSKSSCTVWPGVVKCWLWLCPALVVSQNLMDTDSHECLEVSTQYYRCRFEASALILQLDKSDLTSIQCSANECQGILAFSTRL
jgi:hypothetical protein